MSTNSTQTYVVLSDVGPTRATVLRVVDAAPSQDWTDRPAHTIHCDRGDRVALWTGSDAPTVGDRIWLSSVREMHRVAS